MRARERRAILKDAGPLRRRERALLERLAPYAQPDGSLRWGASTKQLAAELGCSVTTVESARRELVRRGLVETLSGGTGRQRYTYRVVLSEALVVELADTHVYPQAVGDRQRRLETQGLNFSAPPIGTRARRDPSGDQLHPSPTAPPRESCAKHREKPGTSCRACGTSPRHRQNNPRASRTNPRAGYVTLIPPPYAATPRPATGPPPELLAGVRDQLDQLRRRSSCVA